MHGRKRRIGTLIGLLFFVTFAWGLVPIPTSAAFVGDGLGVAVGTALLVLAIINAALSSAVASARHMTREPSARTPSAVIGTVAITMIDVDFVALVVLAIRQ
ncbi:MAG: hypothetical protein H7Z40_03750 [Phycisphaerae bacterium]|nr:hypothetical protein [Gemmatimonadaceae bacterium]